MIGAEYVLKRCMSHFLLGCATIGLEPKPLATPRAMTHLRDGRDRRRGDHDDRRRLTDVAVKDGILKRRRIKSG